MELFFNSYLLLINIAAFVVVCVNLKGYQIIIEKGTTLGHVC